LRSYKKAILDVDIYDDFAEDDYVYSYFIMTLDTKEKKGSLKSGKLKSIVGIEEEGQPNGVECVFQATLSGKTVPLKKVPEDVQSLVLGD